MFARSAVLRTEGGHSSATQVGATHASGEAQRDGRVRQRNVAGDEHTSVCGERNLSVARPGYLANVVCMSNPPTER